MPILVVTNYQSKVLILKYKQVWAFAFKYCMQHTLVGCHWLVAIGFNTKNIFSHYVVKKKKKKIATPSQWGEVRNSKGFICVIFARNIFQIITQYSNFRIVAGGLEFFGIKKDKNNGNLTSNICQ